MDLSIIIPVHNDLRIARCIKSIDEDVEVVVALNRPTKDICDLVKNLDVTTCEIDKNNLGKCYNIGLDSAKYDTVLFMDSDCVFEEGAISKLYQPFKENKELKLSKGRVIFHSDSVQTEITRRARSVNTTNVPFAFIPPLMLKKTVFEKINDGYRFAEDVVWCVDYEFELRRSKAGVDLYLVDDARIHHEPITVKNDFRSAFFYGTGKRIRHERTDEKVNPISVLKDPILRGVKEEGLMIGGYLALWKAVLYSGYYSQKHLNVQGRLNNR